MSGHNKWSKIKHKKAATDAQKSKLFAKHSHLIALESKKARGDVNAPGLKVAMEKARKDNMPQENIYRAVEKGIPGTGPVAEEVVYEAYGPGGTALIIAAHTDNRNRTAAELKHLLTKNNAQLSTPGAALWAFEKKGGVWEPTTTVSLSAHDTEKLEQIIAVITEHSDIEHVYCNAV